MFIIVEDNTITDVVNYESEVVDSLRCYDEATNVYVDEWRPSAGGWVHYGTKEYWVHDGVVGYNE